MKNRIIIPANIIYQDVSHNNEIKEWLKNNYINDISYYKIICEKHGIYLIHNIKENKYYVGSTQSYYWRHLTLGWSSSWRSNIARLNCCNWINKDNLDDFELILIPSEDDEKIRLSKRN